MVKLKEMTTHKLEMPVRLPDEGVVLGLDGGTTSTVCVVMPLPPRHSPPPPLPRPILARSVAGCSNHNSVGATAAMATLESAVADALRMAGATRSSVTAICLCVSGVNHPSDRDRILDWLRATFPSDVRMLVYNDAVAALASGTMGELHGCVLIAGTGTIAYGFTKDGREARAAGAGPVLGDWGSGYGIAARALSTVIRAHDGRGPHTVLAAKILGHLGLPSADELIGWTYEDPTWARIAALVPVVVDCAQAGDSVADNILRDSVKELALSVITVIRRLSLCGKDGGDPCPLVLVGGVLKNNGKWDIGTEVTTAIQKEYPGIQPIRPTLEPAVGAAMLAWNRVVKAA